MGCCHLGGVGADLDATMYESWDWLNTARGTKSACAHSRCSQGAPQCTPTTSWRRLQLHAHTSARSRCQNRYAFCAIPLCTTVFMHYHWCSEGIRRSVNDVRTVALPSGRVSRIG